MERVHYSGQIIVEQERNPQDADLTPRSQSQPRLLNKSWVCASSVANVVYLANEFARGETYIFQRVNAQRLLDRSSRSSANLTTEPVLCLFARPEFLVVFEGYSGEAPHCAHADSAESRSLRADILRTC
jgi:hypothetical protein